MLEKILSAILALIQLLWCVSLFRRSGPVRRGEPCAAIASVLLFLTGFLWKACMGEVITTVIFLAGFILAEFAAAMACYDKLKEVTIPNE